MKLNKFLFPFFISLMPSLTLKAQSVALNIGDKLPETFLKKVRFFDKLSSASTSEYKNKLIILDFWATWCSPCVANLPKMDSLQKKFSNQIRILPVTKQNDNLVAAFFNKFYREKHIKYFSVVEDTILNRLFEHNAIPYCVWINTDGIVTATTEDSEVTEKTIKDALKGNYGSFKIANEKKYMQMPTNKPLFYLANPYRSGDGIALRNIDVDSVVYQSIFTKYITGIRSSVSWDSTGFKASNVELAFLYKSIYNLCYYANYTNAFYSKGRFSIEINNPQTFSKVTNTTAKPGMEYTEWLKLSGVCYELRWGNIKGWPERFEMLKEDMERYMNKPMGLSTSVQKKPVESFVLKRTGVNEHLTTKGGLPEQKADEFTFLIKNQPLSNFVGEFQGHVYQRSPIPFFDETGYVNPVDLEINCQLSDMKAVNKQLERYGLKFSLEKRDADVLIITDKMRDH